MPNIYVTVETQQPYHQMSFKGHLMGVRKVLSRFLLEDLVRKTLPERAEYAAETNSFAGPVISKRGWKAKSR